jgi:hypothetical protein
MNVLVLLSGAQYDCCIPVWVADTKPLFITCLLSAHPLCLEGKAKWGGGAEVPDGAITLPLVCHEVL